MKKLLILFLFAVFFVSCNHVSEYDCMYEITYKVYYPNETVIKNFSFHADSVHAKYICSSWKGTNVLVVYRSRYGNDYVEIEKTTAPINVLEFKIKSIE